MSATCLISDNYGTLPGSRYSSSIMGIKGRRDGIPVQMYSRTHSRMWIVHRSMMLLRLIHIHYVIQPLRSGEITNATRR